MKQFLLLLILSTTSLFAFSQTITISGKVSSADDGSVLPFVSVHIVGSNNGTITDVNGKFILSKVSKKDSIEFSFVGFQTFKQLVGDQTVFNIALQTNSIILNETVITALGVTRQTRELGYSTQKVDGADLQKSDASNVISAMAGKSAGVLVGNSDGVDGGTTRITIRGNNNIDGKNQPLIVVDGVPMENDPGMTSVKSGSDWGSSINNINAQDVADINILKGGAASALYGSRGANGVILITTKSGQKQKGIGISYNLSYKMSSPYRFREVQNKYGGGAPVSFSKPVFTPDSNGISAFPNLQHTDHLVMDQQGNISTTSEEFGYYGSGVSWGPEMLGQQVKWWDGTVKSWLPQASNLAIPFNDGHTTTQNLAFEGGNDLGNMRVSITHLANKPIVDNSEYDQTTVSLNSMLNVSDKVKAVVTASYMDYYRLNTPTLGESSSSFNKGLIYSWPRSYQGEDLENYSTDIGTRTTFSNYPYAYIDPYIWWNYYNNNTTLNRNKFLGGVGITYDINTWLSLMVRTGIDYQLDQFETTHKPIDVVGLKDGYYSNSLSRDRSNNNEFLVSASKENIFHSKFNLKLNLGGSSWHRYQYGINGNSGTWYYPNMYTFSNYTEMSTTTTADPLSKIVPGESMWNKKINSIYSFINLSYSNYLFLELTGRNDWSSALPADNNSYFYPSATLSFIPSEYFNFKKQWLSFWKLRGGVSQTATDTDPYQTSFNYNSSLFGGSQSASYPSTVPPIALKPQRVNSYELGTNADFLNGKISIDFTYYYVYSFDQIMTLPIPTSSGSGYIRTNEGVLTNRGYEIILHATPVQTKDFSFRTSLNFARNRNKVLSLGGNADTYEIANIWGLNGPAMLLKEGDEFGTIYGYDYIYKDGKPVVNADGTKYLITNTRVPIGNASPKFIGGWSTQTRYKNFTLSTQIDTKWGGDIYSGSYVTGLQNGQSLETLNERDGNGLAYTDPNGVTSNVGVILPGVHEDGTTNTTVVHYYYKYLPNAGGWGKFLSTPGIVENTWVKLREVALTYTLPASMAKKTKVFQNLSLSIVGRDLCYLYTTLPDKINPEGILGSGDAQGFEWGAMPGVRSFSFQINAKF